MKKVLITFSGFLLLCALCGAAGFSYVSWLYSPVNFTDTSLRSIQVKKGSTGADVASLLEDQHIIHSAFLLRVVMKWKDDGTPIQTGTYELSPAMNMGKVVDTLAKGPKDAWVTFLEGWRAEEYADVLTTAFGLRYFNQDEFMQLAKEKEGTLFPDTYLFPKQTSAQTIITTMTSTFEKKYQKAVEDLGTPVLSKEQTIVLASLVEREARDANGMKMVAGILINRLNQGIPLQVDSTLQYVKGYNSAQKTWWATPKAADKQLVSPFNTYMNKGLPPAPICNPGLAALSAAIAPAKTDYLFYISDTQGKMHYAMTLEQHNANIEKFLK